MKRCLHCRSTFRSACWSCPTCGYKPIENNGTLAFAAEAEREAGGFNADDFEILAELEDRSFWFRSRNRLVLWAIEEYFPDSHSMLELGCGTGFVLAKINEARPEMQVAGADMFSKGLIHARSRLPDVPLYQLDARDLPFQDEFDLVCAFDVLEHIDADDGALASMFRATRSGGGALVTVPQHQRLWSKSDVDALHVRRYSRRELVSKLVTAGFVVRYITSFITTVMPLMAISRLLSRFNIAAKDPWAEFRQAERIGSVLERLVAIDLAFIRRGVSLPVGGSLLAVASKP